MTHVFGWWNLDPDGPSLVNTVTGERVRHRGAAHPDDATEGEGWARFDYEHTDLRYPLLVRQTVEVRSAYSRTIWAVDHARSAALWRRETDAGATHPPYGVWRRVDDCVADALACWPDASVGGWLHPHLEVVGGWLNGAW